MQTYYKIFSKEVLFSPLKPLLTYTREKRAGGEILRQTWRDLLAKIIADPEEKERIARSLKLARPQQLDKWISGDVKPQRRNIEQLVETISPEYREEFIQLLLPEFPFAVSRPEQDRGLPAISQTFISTIFNAYQNGSPLFFPDIIRQLTFDRMVKHLDPLRQGLVFLVALAREEKVNQRAYLELDPDAVQGTFFWKHSPLVSKLSLYESFLTTVVQTRKALLLNEHQLNREDLRWLQGYEHVKQLYALPLLRRQATAGILLAISSQSDFFSLEYQQLIGQYASLLALAYSDVQFQDPQSFHFTPSSSAHKRFVARQLLEEAIMNWALAGEDPTTLLKQRLQLHERNWNHGEGH